MRHQNKQYEQSLTALNIYESKSICSLHCYVPTSRLMRSLNNSLGVRDFNTVDKLKKLKVKTTQREKKETVSIS